MKSLFQRVLPGVFGKTGGELPDASLVNRSPATAPDRHIAQADATQWSLGARRPLISSKGAVAGFEFRINDETLQRLRRRADPRAASAYVAALLAGARLTTNEGRVGFARVPLDWLTHAAPSEQQGKIWLGLESPAGNTVEPVQQQAMAQAVQRLRADGAKVGWDMDEPIAGLRPDFLLLHQGAAAMPALLTRVTRRPPEFAGLPMLLTDIASLDDFEAAISQGMDYLCGALGTSAPSTTPGRAATLPPEVQRIGQLMNRLATGAETPVIVSEIKGDVSLSYALLRRLSSASYAQIDTGGSIDKAVLMLGRRELHRWLSMLLLQFAPRRKVSKALQEVALWRSRLFELMAQHAGESDPGQLFTLGLASMLGPILNIDASRVVDTLNLPPPARAALLTQDGPWGVYLQVATRLASGHSDGEGTAAAPFGGMTALQVIAEEAWVWAARHVDTGT